jgi:hypothetical protein
VILICGFGIEMLPHWGIKFPPLGPEHLFSASVVRSQASNGRLSRDSSQTGPQFPPQPDCQKIRRW